MSADEYLKGKKVLVMGLGFVSAGATIKWLCDHGAEVTVTDLWPRGTPDKAIEALGDYKDKIKLEIGHYRKDDFDTCDILVVNPSISSQDSQVKNVIKRGIPVENELSLFMRFCPGSVIAITGTRGKTTTATWTHHFVASEFSGAVLAGNMGDTPLLAILDSLSSRTPVIVEASSFQLELISNSGRPKVALITNLMRDHLNRYGAMEQYADAKANIFELQTEDDVLLLKKSDVWSRYFLDKNPKAKIIFYDEEKLGFNLSDNFEQVWGAHNLDNVKAAAHAAHEFGVQWEKIDDAVSSLKAPPFRQEVVYEKNGLTVVNDTTATTPDGTIAALERFSKEGEVILIAGGTDKELDFDRWAKVVEDTVAPKNLILLEGSATDKMSASLPAEYKVNVRSLGTLDECAGQALKRADEIEGDKVVLFSPGAASFEKFQNEFDRGRQFSQIFSSHLEGVSDGS